MEPLPASLLLDHEIARKEALADKGNVMTGCPELDEYVLLGGLERGSVVGVSAEEEEMSMLVGFQFLARLVATEPTANVRVVTMLSMTELVPRLKQALVGQLSGLDGGVEGLKGKVQACFVRISISRVFDVEGLSEVVDELGQAVTVVHDGAAQGGPSTTETGRKGGEGSGVQNVGSTTNTLLPQQQPQPQPAPQSTLPDLVLITHTSSLLSTLFTGRDKDTAHNTAVLLGSHLRTLSHSPAPGGPLIMLLNTTTSSSFPSAAHNNNNNNNLDEPGPIPRTDGRERPTKHPDPTLRSIFNPLPSHRRPTPVTITEAPAPPPAAVSRNKPSFGLIFTQLLDVHLLCTRVPRTRKDREAIVAAAAAAAGTDVFNLGIRPGGVLYVWVVEVLLDEVGVYEGGKGQGQAGGGGEDGDWGWEGRRRRSREQRWGVVDVDGLGRIGDVVW
ncbi:uncharacterized protein C8A04DRAFT_10379 [Dichotomopilus funicola]|uniref:Uncharacterized protein n=1 Tax=Dichotomopilus funicola TaxID=1934379 RepID=A0AAN6ZPZ8_9PEZI|nr:hypothetical protein C8A04DRAFT_10379 [Dichotomopilus funicola]